MASSSWSSEDADIAKDKFKIWPLDDYNVDLLNEVHPKTWPNKKDSPPSQQQQQGEDEEVVYDLISIGAGAGGLVSSRQAARRGGRSAMISAELAGGDCLNAGCVPSKALIRCARMIREVRLAQSHPEEYGLLFEPPQVDFGAIMKRMRRLRAKIAPIDGHEKGTQIGVDVFQGFGSFIDANTIQINNNNNNNNKPQILKFKKAVIATGGKPFIPSNIAGLTNVDYTTNEELFNLSILPKHMIIIGAGVIALEMAQTFATFGSKVTVLSRSDRLFSNADSDISQTIQSSLQNDDATNTHNITFMTNTQVISVQQTTQLKQHDQLPNIQLSISTTDNDNDDNTQHVQLECDCLLVATGRVPNIKGLNLENANVQYDEKKGIIVNDYAQSITNPNVYSVGDCTAGVPKLTHMSGEMAKVVVQNALFQDDWKLSSLVVPACMYTEPEYASVGIVKTDDTLDVYSTTLEHVDRAILDGDNSHGLVKIYCQKNTGIIVGCAIIAARAGDMINEVTLAMKHNITLQGIGRNIHCYPTTGEAIMACGLQIINSKWKRLD